MLETIPALKEVAVPKPLLEVFPEKMTIVHCKYRISYVYEIIRIWQSTYLIEDTGNKQKLVHAERISLMPQWTICNVSRNDFYEFTLYFEGLSKACRYFSLLEEIPEPGGFYTNRIERNQTDVYEAEVRGLK